MDAESREANKGLKSEIKPFARILKIKARTRQPIAVDVINSEVGEGYLPKLNTPEGLYVGEAAATTQNGKCHVLAINTTEQDIEYCIRPQEVIPFDFCEFPCDEFSDSEAENSPAYPQEELGGNYSDRVRRLIQGLHISHLTPEEKEYAFHWAEDYADIFHLNGERLTSTHLLQQIIKLISCPTYFKKSESDYVNKNSHLAIESKEFEFTNHLEINYVQIPCQHVLNKIPKLSQFPTRVPSIRVFEVNQNSIKFAVTRATWNRPELLESRNLKILPWPLVSRDLLGERN